MNLANVLVAIDFSPASLAALERAKALVGTQGTLRLIHVVAVTLAPVHSDRHAVEKFYESVTERARWQLTDVAQDLRNEGFKVETEVTTGRPADEVLTAAARHESDAIILGAHARSALARLALGSVAEEVARRSPVPTFVVREMLPEAKGKVARIVVGVDHDPPSREAARFAGELAKRLGVPLVAVHAVEAPIMPHVLAGEAVGAPRELPKEVVDEIRCRIGEEVAKEVGHEVPVHFLSGSAARELVRFAGKDDLIVLGTHGRSGLGRLAFGSVATKVLRRAPCPVFLVRPPTAAEPSSSAPATTRAAR